VAEVDRPWLLLCLDETLTNAMMHGNEGDPRLHIQVRAAADERRWYLGIDDEGTGFAADQIPDPENPGSATLEHGRGIVMMRSWLDGLMYYRGGRTAVMSRRRADRGE
jgi:serine/threonine-protein kinase RsbW